MKTREIRQRLEHDLRTTKIRLHDQGWPLDPGALGEAAAPDGPAGDPFDRIERTESRERSLDSRERLTERLDRILEAIERLDEGSYGTCVVCGGDIGARRLSAIPEATTCVNCQEGLEVARSSERATRPPKGEARAGLHKED